MLYGEHKVFELQRLGLSFFEPWGSQSEGSAIVDNV